MRSATKALTVLVVAALLMALPTYAQALTVSTDKPSYIPGETVVVTGTAAPGATITVGIESPTGQLVDFKEATAGSDGTYTVSFVIPSSIPTGNWKELGTYTVKAQSAGHTATTTFKIAMTAWVTGTVVDENGNPVAGATVTAVEAGVQTTTDSNGKFTLSVNPGTYTLKASMAGYVSAEEQVTVKTGANDVGTIKLVSLQSEISALKAQIADLQQQLTALNSTLKDQLDQISKSLDDLNTALGNHEATTEEIATQVNNLGSDVAKLQSSLSALQSTLNDLSGKVDSLSTAVNNLKSSMDKLNSDVTSALNDVKGTVSGLRSDIQGLRQDVSSVSGKMDDLSKNLGGKVDSLTPPTYVTIIFARLAFIFALLSWLTVRRALAK
ncbi:MAG: carboxypeptidase regulatory-like domain-containing protein [Desulfurococcales archaeon]|nr:carboxypeptidase regulatory-like domain-containing protein [Desulfurococcales archaeon]